MGEFGVINYQKLSANRPILEVLSLLIDYPTADTFTEANRTLIEQKIRPCQKTSGGPYLKYLTNLLSPSCLSSRPTIRACLKWTVATPYTCPTTRWRILASGGLFWQNWRCCMRCLVLRKRLVSCQITYRWCWTFLAVGDFLDDPRRKDIQLALSVIEDGTYNLLKNAVIDSENPYIKLVKFIREIVGSSVETEVKTDAQ